MRYFKRTELRQVPGRPFKWVSHYEFEGDIVRRQIDLFPEKVLLLQGFECSEATLEDMKFQPQEEFTAAEFAQMWEEYSKLPHGTGRTDHPFIRATLRWPLP